jgi:hypothetical protein
VIANIDVLMGTYMHLARPTTPTRACTLWSAICPLWPVCLLQMQPRPAVVFRLDVAADLVLLVVFLSAAAGSHLTLLKLDTDPIFG